MLVYATVEHLAEWCNPLPDNAATLLREASGLTRKATRCDSYDVDPAGKPTDPDVIAAFRDATCRHVAFWVANGIDPLAGVAGLEQIETSSSIAGGSVSLDAGQNAQIVASMVASLDRLIDPAMGILRDASLASRSPAVW